MTARIVSKQDRCALKREIRRRVGKHIRLAFLFSVVTNLLLLVSPIYMLQVYDRILTSGSIDTLIWISLICLYLLVKQRHVRNGPQPGPGAPPNRGRVLYVSDPGLQGI